MSCDNCRACGRRTGCGACQSGSSISPLARELLTVFAQTPFLPIALDKDSGQIVLVDPELETEAASLALRELQRRRLVSVDHDFLLSKASYDGYEGWAHGSAALTARGQDMLDLLEFGE